MIKLELYSGFIIGHCICTHGSRRLKYWLKFRSQISSDSFVPTLLSQEFENLRKDFFILFLYFATLELLLAHRNSCTSVSTAVICFWQSFKTTVLPIWQVFIDYCLSVGTSPTLSNRVMPCWLLPLITLKKWVLRMLSTTKISFIRFSYAILWKENEIRVRIQKKRGNIWVLKR